MKVGARSRLTPLLCGLFSLLMGVMGSTDIAHAVAGAMSSASVAVDPFADPRVTQDRLTTEAIATSLSPSTFLIDTDQRTAWEDVLVGTSIVYSAYNSATGSASSTGSTIDQFSTASADLGGDYAANGQSLHDVDFTYTGAAGDVAVSAAYDILLQVFADYPMESASGYLLAGIYLRNLTQLTEASDYIELSYATVGAPDDYFNALTGTLATSLAFNTGDAGSFRVIVDGSTSASSVPEPTTIALLGIGMAGVVFLKKRRRN